MGILSRFSDIMEANINAVLSRAEGRNADKLLEKYLQDARESLGQVKAETAAIMADEMAAGRKLSECESEIAKYEGYAMAAVKSGNDDDARKFLAHVEELEVKKQTLQQNYVLAQQNTAKMKQMTSKLVSDISAAEAKMDTLRSQLNMAKQQEKMNKINEKMGGLNPLAGTDGLFDSVQKRIDAAQAAAALNDEMAPGSELKDLEAKYSPDGQGSKSASVEDRLARLKAGL